MRLLWEVGLVVVLFTDVEDPDPRPGLAAPGLGCTRSSLRDAALLPLPSLELVLVELGGLTTLALMVDGLEAPIFPTDVWDVNFGTDDVLTVMDFICCPAVDCGFGPVSSATSLTENSEGLGSLSIFMDCLSWICPPAGPTPSATAAAACRGLSSLSASGV